MNAVSNSEGKLKHAPPGSPISLLVGHALACPLILFLAVGLLGAADDWPQFRGNPQLTGVATGSVPADLRLLWTYDAGDSIESSAAISGGTVYVGSQSKDLLAVDLQTGKLRWKYRATDSIGESSPAVYDGIVYVGDLNGVLHAVNAANGKALWTCKTEAEIRSSPVIAGDRLLIGSYDGNLYCLSRRDGKLVWKFTTGSYLHGTPALEGGVAYVSGCDEVFHGIRLADGQEVVRFPAGGPSGASPAMLGDWAWFGNFNNEVVGASVRQKRILWRYLRPAARFPFYSSAAAAGDRIVVGGRDKLVHCLNATTGKPIWTFPTRARVDSSPAIADGRVYIGSNDGHFYVLDLAAGTKLWDFEAGAPLSASPAIAAGRVVIGSQDGRLYCFGR
jgi:outer membrane protein assembly factor BamB